jgi:hypothetical protein
MPDDKAHPASLSREALYEAVWSTSMVQLSRQYGLSDQGLRKICVKQQVPVPKAGYWAKVAVGKGGIRPPLKPYSEPQAEQAARVVRAKRETERKVQAAAWKPPAPEVVHEAPIRWHPSLGALRKTLTEAASNAAKLQRVSAWEEKRPGSRHPDRDRFKIYGSWKYFSDGGQLLRDSHRKSACRVSLQHYERALRCLNTIIARANERGYTVSMQGDQERLVFKRDEASVTMRLTEKLEEQQRKEYSTYKKAWESVKCHAPTGRLTIFLESTGGGEKAIGDQPNRFLEKQIDDIMETLDVRHAASVKRNEENRLWRLRYEEEQRLRVEQQRREEELRKRAAEEKARREALVAEAAAWRRAIEVRSYLLELDQRLVRGGQAAEDFTEWRAWAESVAIDLDKSGARVGTPMKSAPEQVDLDSGK